MHEVKILGAGCCGKAAEATTAKMVQAAADRLGIAVTIEKVTDYAAIAGYGVVSTPGVVIDGKVVHAGGVPKDDDIAKWLAA
jgi:small redox-active disulfide protein 2